MRSRFETVLDDLDLLSRLASFNPIVIGTPPLGIDIETSDIDVACSACDLKEFHTSVQRYFGNLVGFACERSEEQSEPAMRVVFFSHGWQIELFCQTTPVEDQWGVRHFLVEQRLLQIEPRLKPKIVELKEDGHKTEPAFAKMLNLAGDPFEAILRLELKDDIELAELASTALATKL